MREKSSGWYNRRALPGRRHGFADGDVMMDLEDVHVTPVGGLSARRKNRVALHSLHRVVGVMMSLM